MNQLEGEATEAPVYSSVLEEHNGVTYRIVTNSENFAAIANGSEGEKIIDINLYDPPQYLLTYIEPYAYADFEQLEEVHFRMISVEDGLTIGKNAFANCSNLKKVVFHDNGFYLDFRIEESAFQGSDQVVFYMPFYYNSETSVSPVYLYAQEHNIPVEFFDVSYERIEKDDVIYAVWSEYETKISVSGINSEVKNLTITNPSPSQIITELEAGSCGYSDILEQVELCLPNNPEFTIESYAFHENPNLKKIIFHNDDGLFATIEENAFEDSPQVVFYLPKGAEGTPVYQYAVKYNIPVEFYEDMN